MRIRRNQFINTEKKNYAKQAHILIRHVTSFNRYFIKLIIVSFILFTLFVSRTDLRLENNNNDKEGILLSTASLDDIIIEGSINYSEQLPASKSSKIALAANSFNNNRILADLVAGTELSNDKKVNSEEDIKNPIIVFDENSLVSNSGFQDVIDTGDSVTTYIVENGDSPASIAESFGITTDTVLWANKLKSGDLIRPGDVLKILPISGVEHKVAVKETIDAIAKKYNAKSEDILVYNSLPASGEIKAGMFLIIPNGVMPVAPKPKVKVNIAVVQNNHNENVWVNPSDKNKTPNQSHKFPWGQCTYWVAQKRYVPWGGDAKRWLANAPAYGFKTGKIPAVGAIVVTTENARYGHVAYITEVTETTITFSEMNYKGLGIISQRTLPIKSKVIRGYIY